MATIYLVRHGQASFGADDYDKLSELWRRQAEVTGHYLRDCGIVFDAVYSGDLSRQRETAELAIASQPNPVPHHVDPRFNEIQNDEQVKYLAPKLEEEHPLVGKLLEGGLSSSKDYQKVIEAVFNHWVSPECDDPRLKSWADYSGGVRDALTQVMRDQGGGKTVGIFTSGGTIATMVSRLPGKDESWFPTSKGDYVLLDDGTYGSVLMQSPDVVTLQNKCGHKSWATPDFLALNPRNLSRGYGIFLNFGLDYQHQRLVTREIPDMIRDELEKRLRSYPAGSDVRRVQCMFKEAGASSLDLKVIVFFYGRTADEYYGMHRFIAALLVELCNENDWNIPFGTLTLDMKDELADRVFSPPA